MYCKWFMGSRKCFMGSHSSCYITSHHFITWFVDFVSISSSVTCIIPCALQRKYRKLVPGTQHTLTFLITSMEDSEVQYRKSVYHFQLLHVSVPADTKSGFLIACIGSNRYIPEKVCSLHARFSVL